MRTCIYCGLDKPNDEFSDEHIWPDALGGDFLPPLWRTTDVCRTCNSMSGIFVDGNFIKSWIGSAERSAGVLEYLTLKGPRAGVLPLDYLGPLADAQTDNGEIAEYWAGPCGAIIIHIRPPDSDDHWATYAGGDPRAKKSKAGRAYVALTSADPFWIVVTLASFKAHFDRAERYIVNMDVPAEWAKSFQSPDPSNETHAADLKIVNLVTETGRQGGRVRVTSVIRADLGSRLLAKVGLAIGYKLLGAPFLASANGQDLRRAFREANIERRRQIPVRGTGFLHSHGLGGAEQQLAWPGAWVLLLTFVDERLAFSAISPSGRGMSVVVCDQHDLTKDLDAAYRDGLVWITVPTLGEAVGPVALPAYLGHQLNSIPMAELVTLASKRIDPKALPPCSPP